MRNEINRRMTMMISDFDDSLIRKIAYYGYYLDRFNRIIICFSCNHYIYDNLIDENTDFNGIHIAESPFCEYLSGCDISFRPSNAINGLIGRTKKSEIDQSMWYQPKSYRDLCFEICLFNIQDVASTITPKREISQSSIILFSIYEPLYLPNADESNSKFDVKTFFMSMRCASNRYDTFKFAKYKFPSLLDEYLRFLANSGFFYTLSGTSIQCFACRIVIGNLCAMDHSIGDFHEQYSPNCGFIKQYHDLNVSDLHSPEKPGLKSISTDNTEIQCKICYDNKVNVVYKCGHMMCFSCESRLIETNNITNCQFCRRPLSNRLILYWS